MMNFLLTPSTIKGENNKRTSTSIDPTSTTMQTKLPQVVEHGKETFNDKTRKSLLKINLFIKRLKWFNIFNDTQSSEKQTTTTSKGQESSEEKQKW